MLTVNTYLGPSRVHGIGLFAAEDIPAGAFVWKFNHHVDKIFKQQDFVAMCRKVDSCCLRHLLNSTYRRGSRYFYLTDNARFINHSDDRDNIVFLTDFAEVAKTDIAAHQEILENYNLAYDSSDYFFMEMVNPDPVHYLQSQQPEQRSHA
ncbi:MAG: SET domain-containing protein [Desulfurivibrionaceae bacterium]